MPTPDNCFKCGKDSEDLVVVLVCRQTHSSPAEYEEWCPACRGVDMDDDDIAYARAAAKYGGTGKDWR